MLLRISTSCVAPEGLGCDVRARSATVTELACSPAPRIPWACAGPTVHLVFTHQKNTGPRVRPSQHTRHITTPARTRDDGDLGSFSTTTQGIACFAGLLTIGSCAADRQPGHRRRPDDGAVRPPVPRTRCLPPFEAVPLAFAAGMGHPGGRPRPHRGHAVLELRSHPCWREAKCVIGRRWAAVHPGQRASSPPLSVARHRHTVPRTD